MSRVRQEDGEMHGFVDDAEEFPECMERNADPRRQLFHLSEVSVSHSRIHL